MYRLSVVIGCALLLVGCAGTPTRTAPSSSNNQVERASGSSSAPASGVINPSYKVRGAPVYPGFEMVYGIKGSTELLILVGKDGAPLDIKVTRSSGSIALDRAALNAAIQWQFNPRMKDGVAVDGYVRVPVNYGDTFRDDIPWPSIYASAPIHADEAPMPYGTVQEAEVGVAARTSKEASASYGIQAQTYVLYDDKNVMRERWYFTDVSTDRAMAVRYTFAGTPDHPVTNVAVLCNDPIVCQRRMPWILAGPSENHRPESDPSN